MSILLGLLGVVMVVVMTLAMFGAIIEQKQGFLLTCGLAVLIVIVGIIWK